jgi:outer membrane protein assembly factor BamB
MFKNLDMDNLSDNPKANLIAVVSAFLVSSLAAVVSIAFWLAATPTMVIEASVPGTDGSPTALEAKAVATDLSGVFTAFDGTPSDLPGYWPGFRGAERDNISKADVSLASSWGEGGPEVLWSVDVGLGYAAPAVLNGVVYLLDYDEEERADALRAFSLADGKEIWRRSYEIKIKRNHGMSRTIPAVNEKYIVTVGPKCTVVCLDTATGDFRWGIDLQVEYGSEVPLWYAGQCPIIEDGKAIIAPSGPDTLMMAVDCETGDVLWKTPNPYNWLMSHSSIMPMTLAGKKMYVYCAVGGISGVSAEGDDLGEVLWQLNWGGNVVSPSPIQAGDDKIFMTAGYGKGSMMLQVTESGGAYSVEKLYDKGPKEIIACEQQTPIFYNDLLYSILPADAGSLKKQFACYNPDGTMAWTSGSDNRFGLGPFMVADDKFYLLSDEGVLTMADATTPEYVQLGQAEVLTGHDAWGPFALAGSRLLLRDLNYMICVELGEK